MWVTGKYLWNQEMTIIEKFLVERIIQRCDYAESISKKHRTINGYTQLKELIILCEVTFKRLKTNNTLASILYEAQSNKIRQNICGDAIISKYFLDLKEYINRYQVEKIKTGDDSKDLSEIRGLRHKLKIFEIQLDKYYYHFLKQELQAINYSEEIKIDTTNKKISEYIDLLIPFLLYSGYSISSINTVLRRWIKKEYRITISRILTFFNFKEKDYDILISIGEKNEDTDDFTSLVHRSANEGIKQVKYDSIKTFLPNKTELHKSDILIKYSVCTIDPNAHIRNQYDSLLKKLVIGKDRKTLSPFTHFFDHCYWLNPHSNKKIYKQCDLNGDPINVPCRTSTFRSSLILDTSIDFKEKDEIIFPRTIPLQKAIYYYNLALGSKSLENSLSLLWTATETLLPYRVHKSDIESVKYLFGKALSIGSFSRDLFSLSNRIKSLSGHNVEHFRNSKIDSLGDVYSNEGIKSWFNWIVDKEEKGNTFQILKESSELCAFEFIAFAKPIQEEKLKIIGERIKSSKESIEYQLQRIYLHRNQIVHSGDFINVYSNLWLHLEWYIGKLIYYCYSQIEIKKEEDNIEDIFRKLESEYDYITSYILKNNDKQCLDSKRIFDSLLEFHWQSTH